MEWDGRNVNKNEVGGGGNKNEEQKRRNDSRFKQINKKWKKKNLKFSKNLFKKYKFKNQNSQKIQSNYIHKKNTLKHHTNQFIYFLNLFK